MTKSDLTVTSLFDGIGGFPLAFLRAGVPTVVTCEIDKAAAGVAAMHFPSAVHFPDVTEIKPDDIVAAGFDPDRGILTGGWPCTDLSLAGLRLGLGGARSGLVGEVFRILAGLQPRWVVLENVPGLLSSVCPCPGGGTCTDPACAAGPHVVRGGGCGRAVQAGRFTGPGQCMALHGGGMGTVLGALVECGYGVAYRVLDAQHFGVPQRRRRVVIVGRLGNWADPAEILLEPECGGRHPASLGQAEPGTARGAAVGTLLGGGRGFGLDVNSANDGHIINTLTSHHGRNDPSEGQLVAHTPIMAFGHTNGIDVQASEHVTPTLRAGHDVGGGSIAGPGGVRRLTPVECERLQGFPDGWTATSYGRAQADAPRYRQLGNAIAVPVFEWVARRLVLVDQVTP